MTDIVDSVTRSRIMAAIRSRDSTLEMRVRRYLHSKGFRYRLHAPELPGKPDLWFPSRCAAVFVNGCFFHGHDCGLFRLPATRAEFWQKKIGGNQARDLRVRGALDDARIRTITVWECVFRDKQAKLSISESLASIAQWLETGKGHAILSSKGFTELNMG